MCRSSRHQGDTMAELAKDGGMGGKRTGGKKKAAKKKR
jgi:hypothetical protein